MSPAEELALFTWAACGNADAGRFLQQITDAAHAWDDVVDGDVPLDRAALDAAFRALVLDIPANPFYRAHRASLEPLIAQAALNWQVATAIERDPCAPKQVAYIVRSSYIDLVGQVALLTGGPLWAVEVIRRVRTLNQSESFSEYLTNLAAEAQARAVEG